MLNSRRDAGRFINVDGFIAKYAPTERHAVPTDDGYEIRRRLPTGKIITENSNEPMVADYCECKAGANARYQPGLGVIIGETGDPSILAHELFGHAAQARDFQRQGRPVSANGHDSYWSVVFGQEQAFEQDAWDRAKGSGFPVDPAVESASMDTYRDGHLGALYGGLAGSAAGLLGSATLVWSLLRLRKYRHRVRRWLLRGWGRLSGAYQPTRFTLSAAGSDPWIDAKAVAGQTRLFLDEGFSIIGVYTIAEVSGFNFVALAKEADFVSATVIEQVRMGISVSVSSEYEDSSSITLTSSSAESSSAPGSRYLSRPGLAPKELYRALVAERKSERLVPLPATSYADRFKADIVRHLTFRRRQASEKKRWLPLLYADDDTSSGATVREGLSSDGPWTVAVLNDERHTFPEIEFQVMKAIGCPLSRARQIAREINEKGASAVCRGTEEACKQVAAVLVEIELTARVLPVNPALPPGVSQKKLGDSRSAAGSRSIFVQPRETVPRRFLGSLIFIFGATISVLVLYSYFFVRTLNHDSRGLGVFVVGLGLANFGFRWMRGEVIGGTCDTVWIDPRDPALAKAAAKAKATLPALRALTAEAAGAAEAKVRVAFDSGVSLSVWRDVVRVGDTTITLLDDMARPVEFSMVDVEDWLVRMPDGTIRGGFSRMAEIEIFHRETGYLPPHVIKQAERYIDAER
jgi:hypothetical protein